MRLFAASNRKNLAGEYTQFLEGRLYVENLLQRGLSRLNLEQPSGYLSLIPDSGTMG